MASTGERRGDREQRVAATPEEGAQPLALPRDVIGEVYVHAVECYPEECCGVALGPAGSLPERVVRCTNVQDRQLSRGESTLDARRAFWIDERELLDAARAAEAEGKTICMIYHSHTDTGAYFSRQDLEGAVGLDGAPLWPHAAQLVVAVHEGVVREAALYEWDPERRAYVGRRVREGS